MTKTLQLCSLFLAVLLLFTGCSRPPAAESGGGSAGKVPQSLIAEAAGKVAFIEFYAPT